VTPRRVAAGRSEPIDQLIKSLSQEELVEVVLGAVEQHDDVAAAVRLVASRSSDDLAALRHEVDRGLRTRRFLGYWEAMEWARAASPVVAELELAAHTRASQELVTLLERAAGHVVKVIHHADDSSGLIGELVRELLELHALACDAGVADPVKLADWMIRFQFDDQDVFELDPVRYADALGEEGLAAYRQAIEELDDGDSFAARHARERLAVLDHDVDMIVELAGGALRNSYQFFRVAHALSEIGRDDLVLEWTARGIEQCGDWQVSVLYDFACETQERLGQPLEVLRLRRAHHERMPSSSTYGALRTAAQEVDAWELERDAARALLRDRDVRGFVHALLEDGDADFAWDVAVSAAPEEIDADQWVRLAGSREPTHPSDALMVYLRVADEILQETDRRAYARAVRLLKLARSVAEAAGERHVFDRRVSGWRERYRRRPTMIAMFDKANLSG
jgi:hypothetical protein